MCLKKKNKTPIGLRRGLKAVCIWLAVIGSADLEAARDREVDLTRDLRVVFLDVGQGDCTFIQTPAGKKGLIDGGGTPGWSKSGFEPGREKVVPFLKKEGVSTLDFVLISHPHGDHIAGLLEVFRRVSVKTLFDPGLEHDEPEYPVLLKIAREKGTDYQVVGEGDTLDWDPSLRVETLSPPRDFAYETLNDNSIVFRMTYGEVSFLFCGDAEADAESRLVRKHKRSLRAQILKVPHHGSRTSTTPRFIDAVRPSVAVVCVGRGNVFRHPAPQTISRLESRGIRVHRTDVDGDIEVRTDGRKYEVSSQYSKR